MGQTFSKATATTITIKFAAKVPTDAIFSYRNILTELFWLSPDSTEVEP